MGKDFFRFPSTPHLAWLAKDGMPRDDKVLSPAETQVLLSGDVVVEEKLDGANLGLSLSPDGALRAQNRGQYLRDPHAGQFARLSAWLAQHEPGLRTVLRPELMLFGEWCAARHSLSYDTLPDWFLLFDVYDGCSGRFWSTSRRNALVPHRRLHDVVSAPGLTPAHFARWLALWTETVDDRHAGPVAGDAAAWAGSW